ncbi:hypothetical protein Dvina_20630 [Dactylosporangium vinaceum]|uniref:Uncharacterized protein n=1 Tax=Dactylosporangium vinaceum TaxID=53362 RepID=A0ABV5MS50_9ACTN|nr:hypothetical protein [Dactylosporangium vinaceum]UAC00254.1 hypothetical protein Dvina_20630 [Dactylosporangium vinaceum]
MIRTIVGPPTRTWLAAGVDGGGVGHGESERGQQGEFRGCRGCDVVQGDGGEDQDRRVQEVCVVCGPVGRGEGGSWPVGGVALEEGERAD